ncbi:MAG: YHS domain-containing protein [Planctomycetes bacterium]|nr:YHS domain-containing protein [Planctomycetota bacterium]
MTKDIVCGMEVDESKALKLQKDGKAYFFCNPSCMDKFKSDPEKYLLSSRRQSQTL